METFLNYIGDNYDKVKRNLLKICNGFNEELFDEDIFHDTIIKIDKHLGKKLLNDCEYEKLHRVITFTIIEEEKTEEK